MGTTNIALFICIYSGNPLQPSGYFMDRQVEG